MIAKNVSRTLCRGLAALAAAGCAVGAQAGPPPTALPTLSINDVSMIEGQAGATTLSFTVSLSAPALTTVTFDIATADGTATQGSDYDFLSLTGQTIGAGASAYTFNVQMFGDTAVEPNETFFVNVTNITSAIAVDAQGQGTIVNDDRLVPTPAVPEPSTYALMALGLLAVGATARRRGR